jgi:hypothetical protein
VHKERAGSEQPGINVLKLLKTQDIGYVSMKQRAEAKKIERLRASLHRASGAAQGQRTSFVSHDEGDSSPHAQRRLPIEHPFGADDDSDDDSKPASLGKRTKRRRSRSKDDSEFSAPASAAAAAAAAVMADAIDAAAADVSDSDDAAPEAARPKLSAAAAADALAALVSAGRASADASLRQSSTAAIRAESAAAPASQLLAAARGEDARTRVSSRTRKRRAKAASKRSAAAYKELHDREERAAVLGKAAAHFEYQRHLMGKGRRVKVKSASGGQPAVFKWKQERKR